MVAFLLELSDRVRGFADDCRNVKVVDSGRVQLSDSIFEAIVFYHEQSLVLNYE